MAPVLLLLLCLAGGTRADEDPYEQAEAYYEANIDRPPLAIRLGAMQRLARTRDARALEVLSARYVKPRVPKDHERYLLASVIGRHLTDADHAPALAKLRERFKRDEHAWLWYCAARAEARGPGANDLLEGVLSDRERPFLRAGLLERLATEGRPEALAAASALTGEGLPRKGTARTVLLESAAAALLAHANEAGGPAFDEAARGIIDLLARDDLEDRTRLVVARHLAKTFGTEHVTLDHEYWRRVLAAHAPLEVSAGTVTGRPRFFGLEATGSRVAYLIDLSDSMLDPLTERERADARELASQDEEPEGAVERDPLRTRFDLARTYLRQSLEELDSGVSFMVIGFGREAEPFRSTRELVRASRGNVREAIRELDAIEPGRPTARRPYGTLRGETNLHGALLRAFRATTGKRIDELEHVDETALAHGCDTIFVFSDGRPNEDDFAAGDRFGGGRITTDTETGETGSSPPGSARYYGPYRNVGNLLEDVRRMNLFRKAEIHTVAMGEADNDLMRRLADLGLGRYRSLGFLGREGMVNAWWVVGPFPAPDLASWEKTEAPEESADPTRPVRIGDHLVPWTRRFGAGADGVLTLQGELEPDEHVAAYALAEIEVEAAGRVRLEVGSDDGIRLWLNGEVVHTKLVRRALKVGGDRVEVDLVAGVNRLLAKVCNVRGRWAFSLRVRKLDGTPLDFRLR